MHQSPTIDHLNYWKTLVGTKDDDVANLTEERRGSQAGDASFLYCSLTFIIT